MFDLKPGLLILKGLASEVGVFITISLEEITGAVKILLHEANNGEVFIDDKA